PGRNRAKPPREVACDWMRATAARCRAALDIGRGAAQNSASFHAISPLGRRKTPACPRDSQEPIMSNSKHRRGVSEHHALQPVASNGLIDRRALLGRGILFAGATATGVGTSLTSAAADPLPVDPWSMGPGAAI